MRPRKWTPEILDYIRSLLPLKENGISSIPELTDIINKKFNMDFSCNSVRTSIYLNKITTGLHPWIAAAPRKRPLYSIRWKDDCLQIKVAEDKWVAYALYLYTQAHKIDYPSEDVRMYHLDGDKTNFCIDNLEMLTLKESFTYCKHRSLYPKKNLTKEERMALITKARMSIAITNLIGSAKRCVMNARKAEKRKKLLQGN